MLIFLHDLQSVRSLEHTHLFLVRQLQQQTIVKDVVGLDYVAQVMY